MIFSLNQIDQISRKAARGAGLPWGLADDAGKAVRWLHACGLNGAAALANLLDRQDYRDCRPLAPASLSGVWRAPGGALDPLLAGAALSDCLAPARDAPVETGAIAHPLLAAGLVGHMAEIEDRAFTLTWPDVCLCCRRGGLRVAGEPQAVEAASAGFMVCRPATADGRTAQGRWRAPKAGETAVEAGVWARLERYARRTHVEATEASRRGGAGAGLRDND